MRAETLIVGAGLSGLSVAAQLVADGRTCHILEARDRVGGRVHSTLDGGAYFDMGPAWFWPGQPRIERLVCQLGLRPFEQFATGDQIFEDENGRVQRGPGFASMRGSYRLAGGLVTLVNGLHDQLPPASVTRSCKVIHVAQSRDGIRVETDQGQRLDAKRIVLAMPPRLAATLTFAPALPEITRRDMLATPTWMAGQAKVIATYTTPFWRAVGLSGDAISRRGPLVEIHDASTQTRDHHALFGFVGVPPDLRGDADHLYQASLTQLARLFGPEAQTPVAVHVKDWAQDPLTATPDDRKPQGAHPHYGLPQSMRGLWNGRLIFAGSEVAPQFGGYLEGALEAAEIAVAALNRNRAH